MPSRLALAVDSLNPMRGEIGADLLAQRAFRLTGLLAIVLLPLYGWIYHASGLSVVDPWLLRGGFSAVIACLVALTYVSEPVRRSARVIHEATMVSLTTYFGWLASANGLAADYAVGFLFVFAGLALSHSIAYTRCEPFARYLVFSAAVSVLAVTITPEAGVSRPLFLLSVGGLALMLYVAVGARMATHEALAKSRERLAAAEALAGTGSWDHDFKAGHRIWSDGLYGLFGMTPPADRSVSAPALYEAIHPSDRAEVENARTRMLAEGTQRSFRFRAVGPDGDVRSFRAVVTLARDRAGRPELATGAVVDMTEHDRREAALRDALGRAEEGARAKSDFLANMSHEIRTPLTAIIGYAQILADEIGDAHTDLVGPIETGGLRLLDTLNSVLDLARMEAGHSDLALTPVDAGAEARATVEMLAGRASARGLALEAHVDTAVPPVLADRAALGRVLANLVSNAVKFTDAGEVTVCVRNDRGAVEVAVTDTGCGMDDAFLASLYEPFLQASTGWGRSHEGTGLGLTITRRLVEGMGGEIRVASAPGVGTTFTVVLRTAEALAEAPSVSAREPAAA